MNSGRSSNGAGGISKRGSQFLSERDTGSSGASSNPKKDKKSENIPTKRSRIPVELSDISDNEDDAYDAEYSGYQCDCGWKPDKEDLQHNNEIIEKIQEQIDDMEDDKWNMFGMMCVDDVDLTVPITCPKCRDEIEINVEADADIIWEEDAPDHRPPNIDGYQLTGYRVLQSDEPTGSRDLMAAGWHAMEPDYEDLDHPYFDIPDDLLEEPTEIELDIICKTRMNRGYCLMGLDQENRLRRPIYRTGESCCCWPVDKNFKVWNRYRFKVLRYPEAKTNAPTPFPHSTEDTVVQESIEHVGVANKSSLFNRMRNIAVSKPEETFGPLKELKYVDEGTKCSSVAILKCEESNLEVKTEYGKKRLIINLPGAKYNFPLTGLEYHDPGQSDEVVLVLLGLARPWDNKGAFNPARCYVLALNIIKHGN